jgi:plasmid stability protein
VRYRQWEGNMSKRKLEMCATSLKILATRQSHSQVAEFRPVYRQSVAIARARLELAYARRQLETDPAGVAPLIWRAWRIYPRRLKWLLWFAMVRWPKWLAGKSPREMVYRKLRAKF